MPREVTRRAVRGILLDDDDNIVLLRRTRPDRPVYWVAPGGGVEPTDASLEAALQRELAEELGARADRFSRVFLFSSVTETRFSVQYVYVCHLVSLDLATRNGPEFADPTRGSHDPDPIPLFGNRLAELTVKPAALLEFILANREALHAEITTPINPITPSSPVTGTTITGTTTS